uniref:Uncharacterized protein n=2 Tax=Vibrionaceae TaxID=641 RepID=A0A0H3ZWF6_VIBSP|nr:hypothetical protein [Enterovibrio norvegicus]AKN40678.1 hypothetical protein [Vibrio splendidus]
MHLTDKMSVTQVLISLFKTQEKHITYTSISSVRVRRTHRLD